MNDIRFVFVHFLIHGRKDHEIEIQTDYEINKILLKQRNLIHIDIVLVSKIFLLDESF